MPEQDPHRARTDRSRVGQSRQDVGRRDGRQARVAGHRADRRAGAAAGRGLVAEHDGGNAVRCPARRGDGRREQATPPACRPRRRGGRGRCWPRPRPRRRRGRRRARRTWSGRRGRRRRRPATPAVSSFSSRLPVTTTRSPRFGEGDDCLGGTPRGPGARRHGCARMHDDVGLRAGERRRHRQRSSYGQSPVVTAEATGSRPPRRGRARVRTREHPQPGRAVVDPVADVEQRARDSRR